MSELDIKPKNENDWIDWIINHMFDLHSGITQEIMDIISYNDLVTSMTLDLDDGHVTITKS